MYKAKTLPLKKNGNIPYQLHLERAREAEISDGFGFSFAENSSPLRL
jgi:hypothetical protein